MNTAEWRLPAASTPVRVYKTYQFPLGVPSAIPLNVLPAKKPRKVNKKLKIPKPKTVSQYYINELIAQAGYTVSRIARESQIPRPTVNHLLNGTILEVGHKTFSKLLSLYCRVFYMYQHQGVG